MEDRNSRKAANSAPATAPEKAKAERKVWVDLLTALPKDVSLADDMLDYPRE